MIHILFLAANPSGSVKGDWMRQYRTLEESIKRSENRDKITITVKWVENTNDLSRVILEKPYRIIHFIGNLSGDGKIILKANATQEPKFIQPKALAELFSLFAESLKLIILDRCYSPIQQQEIIRHIPYVIGTGNKVNEKKGRKFAAGFYDAIAAKRSIDWAFKFGIKTTQLDENDTEGFTLHSNKDLLEEIEAKERLASRITIQQAQEDWIEISQRRKSASDFGLESEIGETLLEQFIRNLNITIDMELIDLVNCNRTEHRKYFWNGFEDRFDSNFQVHFTFNNSCPSQQPNSFAERMVYELIADEGGQYASIDVEREHGDGRVIFRQFPIGRNAKASRIRLLNEFGKRYGIGRFPNVKSLFEKESPAMRHQYFICLFHIQENDWVDWVGEIYLPELMSEFSDAAKVTRVHTLFFLVIYSEGIHREESSKKNKISQQVLHLGKKWTPTFLNGFNPVDISDFREWFRRINVRNNADIENIIQLMIRGLPDRKKEIYQTYRLLDMEDVERTQALVYDIVNE